MIKFENTEVLGWEHAVRGMRNPLNSWEKGDSYWNYDFDVTPEGYTTIPYDITYKVGPNDLKLMKRLRNAGTDHRKFMRMLTVYVDILAPLYWWKEFDTYKVGTVANSCSTMHTIHKKEFDISDFSFEQLIDVNSDPKYFNCVLVSEPDSNGQGPAYYFTPWDVMEVTIDMLNKARELYLQTKDKKYWWQMIQLLPTSYNQKRTVMLNYEVLANIYKSRKDHKLMEWSEGFVGWIKELPYSELITGEDQKLEYADQPGLALGA